ncbi:hypothetical protein EW146_g369 [Bondarzewia mesenterica]|uniref:Uncharacterized protein n=1 Tax=Bondarzewia mesenterica TaxID=1095465 RepID=A0A4S4M771_9AGAM|nr:hypothetical protein EW146_g369 [Bondarzewia mesenterica]
MTLSKSFSSPVVPKAALASTCALFPTLQCEQFAERGCKVYATARKVEKMQGFTVRSEIEPLALDVTSDEDVQRVVESIVAREGKIDILVNNAGVGCYGPVLEVPLEQVKNVFDANTFSILRVSRAVVPHMASHRQGLIVNIGSIVGEMYASIASYEVVRPANRDTCFSPTPWAGIYAASKAATHALTEVLSMECRPFNIRVCLVAPGGVRSNIASSAMPVFKLPPDTLYAQFLDNIVARMWSSQSPRTMSTAVFARKVVTKALAREPPFYYSLGYNSTLFQFLKWLPRTWVMWALWRSLASTKAGAK